MDNDIKLQGKIEFRVPSSQGGEHSVILDFETAAELKGILQYAQKENWKPRFFTESAPSEHPAQTSTNGSKTGTPVCPVHHKPMKPSTAGEGWYCPRKMGTEWCKARSLDGMTVTMGNFSAP